MVRTLATNEMKRHRSRNRNDTAHAHPLRTSELEGVLSRTKKWSHGSRTERVHHSARMRFPLSLLCGLGEAEANTSCTATHRDMFFTGLIAVCRGKGNAKPTSICRVQNKRQRAHIITSCPCSGHNDHGPSTLWPFMT